MTHHQAPAHDVTAGVLPVACTLGPPDGAARMVRWRQLLAAAQAERTVRPDRLEIAFRPVAGMRAELTELVAAERRCCAFVTWTLTEAQGIPVLVVTGDPAQPEQVGAIAALFGRV